MMGIKSREPLLQVSVTLTHAFNHRVEGMWGEFRIADKVGSKSAYILGRKYGQAVLAQIKRVRLHLDELEMATKRELKMSPLPCPYDDD